MHNLKRLLGGYDLTRRESMLAAVEASAAYVLSERIWAVFIQGLHEPLADAESLDGKIAHLKRVYPHFADIGYESVRNRDRMGGDRSDWTGYPVDKWIEHYYASVHPRVTDPDKMEDLLYLLTSKRQEFGRLVHVMERPDLAMYKIEIQGYSSRSFWSQAPVRKQLVIRALVPLRPE